MFPPNGSRTRRPLPSAGFGRSPFPRFAGTMRRSDALPPVALRFLVSLGATTPCACVRDSLPARRRPAAWGFRVGQPHARCWRGGNGRASQVPGGPSCVYALFLDPGRTERTRPLRCAGTAPAPSYGEGSRASVISGLNGTAWTLAVFASPPELPRRDARRASGCWPSSTGQDWLPARSRERLQKWSLHVIPLSQVSWRKQCPLFRSPFPGASGAWGLELARYAGRVYRTAGDRRIGGGR